MKPALDVRMQFYCREYKEFSKQLKAINLFLELMPIFRPQEQGSALAEYYTVFLSKNLDREVQIKALNSEFSSELSKEEQIFEEKKVASSRMSGACLEINWCRIVFITFVALYLMLQSFQRNFKLLRENYPKIQYRNRIK